MSNSSHNIDPSLRQWATESQARCIDALIEHGSLRKAADAIGVHNSYICRVLAAVRRKAAVQPRGTDGFVPREVTTHYDEDGTETGSTIKEVAAPWAEPGGVDAGPARDGHSGYMVKGVSTYYDAEGQQRGQWVKTRAVDAANEQLLEKFVAWLHAEGIVGLAPMAPAPEHGDDELLTVYPMGDPHFGLHSWAAETGDDFDLKEAERVTLAAIDRLVTAASPSTEALLLNLGDFFHADDSTNETPGHHNKLDVDSRYGKIAQVGLRTMIACIKRLLEKHQRVLVWNLPGNHDPHLAQMLSLCLDAFFNNEPRVTVDLSPSLYRYLRFGNVLIGAHHGHGAKGAELPLLMAADRAEDWGLTKHRVWLCGHIHHYSAKEHPGVTVETFRTLAGKDAWHAGKGYRSGRDMNVITFHCEHGEIQRTRCDFGMLQ